MYSPPPLYDFHKDHRTSDHNMYVASWKNSKNYKAQPYHYASPSKQILKAKAKPFPPCTYYGFNDYRPDDYRMYPECEICGINDHATSGYNCVILVKGGVLAKSYHSSESSFGVSCNTCGSTVHSTTDHSDFEHFKKETHQGAHLVPEQWMLKEYDWCQELSAQICREISSEVMPLTYQEHSPRERPGLGTMKHTKPDTQESLSKSISGPVIGCTIEPVITSVPTEVKNNEQGDDHRTSDHNMYVASLKNSENYKAQPYQYASPSKQIMKAKAKPFPLCTHYGFNYNRPDDCGMYRGCEIYGSNDHAASGYNCVILVK
ncbi:hypothetical protein Tco_1204983, partial [Tanacetum coccineum]